MPVSGPDDARWAEVPAFTELDVEEFAKLLAAIEEEDNA